MSANILLFSKLTKIISDKNLMKKLTLNYVKKNVTKE